MHVDLTGINFCHTVWLLAKFIDLHSLFLFYLDTKAKMACLY